MNFYHLFNLIEEFSSIEEFSIEEFSIVEFSNESKSSR